MPHNRNQFLYALLKFDYLTLILAFALGIVGYFFILSSEHNNLGIITSYNHQKQLIFLIVSSILAIFMSFISFEYYKNWFILFLYIIGVGSITLPIFFGNTINGANSWLNLGFMSLQPSEPVKVITILFLAFYLEKVEEKIKNLFHFLIALIIISVPMGLALAQPDLGTAMVYFALFTTMMFSSKTKIRYLLFIIFIGIIGIVTAIYPVWIVKNKLPFNIILNFLNSSYFMLYIGFLLAGALSIFLLQIKVYNFLFYWFSYFISILGLGLLGGYLISKFLKEYQIMRLIVFLKPEIDPLGSSWNILQSLKAIESGSKEGHGFLKGVLSHSNYVPYQQTDFIFSIIAEEWGFYKTMIFILIYALFFIRILWLGLKNKTSFGLYIASGIFGVFFFHFMINIGMAMSIMPITGIPLLFISYGGSSLLSAFMMVSLLMSLSFFRKDKAKIYS